MHQHRCSTDGCPHFYMCSQQACRIDWQCPICEDDERFEELMRDERAQQEMTR